MSRSRSFQFLLLLIGLTVLTGQTVAAQPAGALRADFNGDGFADLAVGAPFESVGVNANAGAVHVFYGTAAGLTAAGSQIWHQDTPGIQGVAETGDAFGRTLATADFDGDGWTDLAVGARAEGLGAKIYAGAVHILYGSAAGLSADRNQFWSQDSPGIIGIANGGDLFGVHLTTGDYNGDGNGDLAVGVLREKVSGLADAGAVNVIYGSPSGLAYPGNQYWHQDSVGIEDAAEEGDWFGRTVASGDFNGDGLSDLAVGVRYEDVGTVVDAGAVNVLYGSATGLSAGGNQFLHQNSPGMAESAKKGDNFSYSLAGGDYNGDGIDDLAAGAPFKKVDGIGGAGTVSILNGSATGLTTAGNQFWSQNSPDILSDASQYDNFGRELARGDFNGDGRIDLAVAVYSEDVGGHNKAGAVGILYGTNTGLSAAGNQLWTQDSAGIEDQAEAGDLFGSGLSAGNFNGDGVEDLGVGVSGESIDGAKGAGAANVIYGTASGLASGGNQFWHQNSPGVAGDAEEGDAFGMWLAP
jgi:hypothetical protein